MVQIGPLGYGKSLYGLSVGSGLGFVASAWTFGGPGVGVCRLEIGHVLALCRICFGLALSICWHCMSLKTRADG